MFNPKLILISTLMMAVYFSSICSNASDSAMEENKGQSPALSQEPNNLFAHAKLIYKTEDPFVTPNTTTTQIFHFSAAPNIFEHTFDLSILNPDGLHEDLQAHICITTDPARFFEMKDNSKKAKLHFLIAHHSLIEQKIKTTAEPFAEIFKNWNKDVAPVGFFWRSGWDTNLSRFEHLITCSPEELSACSLYKHWSNIPHKKVHLWWWIADCLQSRFYVQF